MSCRTLLFTAIPLVLVFASNAYAGTLTRTSSFEYNANTGLLTKEIIEPGNSNLCLVTSYINDAFGNKKSATTRNCNGSAGEAAAPTGNAVIASRTSSTAYDSAGRFAISSTNALGHTETRQYQRSFGKATSLTGPNGLMTLWSYDAFGRKAAELRTDFAETDWTYGTCASGCPTGAKYSLTAVSTGSPTSTSYYDLLNREIRSETQGFDGTLVRKCQRRPEFR